MKLKVNNKEWKQAMDNLMNRRSSGVSDNSKCESPIADYASHVSKVKVGKTVLDVGCGDMGLRKHLPEDTMYIGLDAFPVNEFVHKGKIEDVEFVAGTDIDTIFAFAVLDGLQDLEKAFENMKKNCNNNMVFLTGIDIEPDQYHTHKITLPMLQKLAHPFKQTFIEYLSPKVILIEFTK